MTGDAIPCNFDQDVVGLNEVKDALPHRVRVYGCARFGKDGRISSFDVTKLWTLPETFVPLAELPSLDITEGMQSVEYIERLRSGEL